MGIRCLQRPDPGRSALGKGQVERVSGMTTMGLRGVLACAFIVSTSLLTGMAAMPSGASASEPAVATFAAQRKRQAQQAPTPVTSAAAPHIAAAADFSTLAGNGLPCAG